MTLTYLKVKGWLFWMYHVFLSYFTYAHVFIFLCSSSSPPGVFLEKDYEIYRDYNVDGQLLHYR